MVWRLTGGEVAGAAEVGCESQKLLTQRDMRVVFGTRYAHKKSRHRARYWLEAPQGEDSSHQMLLELGAWKIRRLQHDRCFEIHPWTTPESLPTGASKPLVVKHNPVVRARFYHSLIAGGVVKNRAELARMLGVSRARITQILNRTDGENN